MLQVRVLFSYVMNSWPEGLRKTSIRHLRMFVKIMNCLLLHLIIIIWENYWEYTYYLVQELEWGTSLTQDNETKWWVSVFIGLKCSFYAFKTAFSINVKFLFSQIISGMHNIAIDSYQFFCRQPMPTQKHKTQTPSLLSIQIKSVSVCSLILFPVKTLCHLVWLIFFSESNMNAIRYWI